MAFRIATPSFIGRWKALRPEIKSHAAGALVDDGGLYRFGQIAFTGTRAAGIDQSRAAQIAVDDLIARKVDRMIANVSSE